MTIYEKHPKICQLCGGNVIYTSNSIIYGKEYGNGKCYYCQNCHNYVGVHNNTDIALGIIADEDMRTLKKECHNIFDKLWKDNKRRNNLYYELSKQMNIKREHCHFGHFDKTELKQALEILKNNKLKKEGK